MQGTALAMPKCFCAAVVTIPYSLLQGEVTIDSNG